MLGPGGSAHLPSGRYWHVVSPGTTIGDAFFTLSIPTSEISLAPSARMWQQLLLASQAERNDLGRPSRAYPGIPQCDPRIDDKWSRLSQTQRISKMCTIPKVSIEEPCKAWMLQESSR